MTIMTIMAMMPMRMTMMRMHRTQTSPSEAFQQILITCRGITRPSVELAESSHWAATHRAPPLAGAFVAWPLLPIWTGGLGLEILAPRKFTRSFCPQLTYVLVVLLSLLSNSWLYVRYHSNWNINLVPDSQSSGSVLKHNSFCRADCGMLCDHGKRNLSNWNGLHFQNWVLILWWC